MLAGIFLFFTLNIFGYVVFSFYLCRKLKILSKMRNVQWAVLAITGLVVLAGCKEKKQSQDIIAPRLEVKKPSAPIRMQTYSDQRSVEWLGKEYKIEVKRTPDDSLRLVKDETGQQFVDNIFTLTVKRKDGSVFFNRTFTKQSISNYLDDDYRRTGIFEGLVFDKADGDWLVFGASVGHPQTDEYIPLVIRLSRMGNLVIKRDVQMDTQNVDTLAQSTTDEDDV